MLIVVGKIELIEIIKITGLIELNGLSRMFRSYGLMQKIVCVGRRLKFIFFSRRHLRKGADRVTEMAGELKAIIPKSLRKWNVRKS